MTKVCKLIFLIQLSCGILHAEEGFYTLSDLPQRPEYFHFEEIKNSVQKMNNVCSLFITSNSGYGFTAKHCISSCLKKPLQNSELTNSYCRFLPKGAELIAVGRETLSGDISKHLKELDPLEHFDYALIKTKPSKYCLRATDEVSMNEPVWSMGYPINPIKSSAPFQETTYYVNRENQKNPSPNRDFRIVYGKYLGTPDRDYILQTSADLVGGLSGGPLLNQYGEVIGLASFVNTSTFGDYKATGHSNFISIKSIKEELRNQYPEGFIERVFDCQMN